MPSAVTEGSNILLILKSLIRDLSHFGANEKESSLFSCRRLGCRVSQEEKVESVDDVVGLCVICPYADPYILSISNNESDIFLRQLVMHNIKIQKTGRIVYTSRKSLPASDLGVSQSRGCVEAANVATM